MLVIETGDHVTVINVSKVQPQDQGRALDIRTRVNARIGREPGFMGAAAHRSLDGKRVADYARWRSEQEIRTALAIADLRPMLAELTAITQPDWHLYQGASVAAPPGT